MNEIVSLLSQDFEGKGSEIALIELEKISLTDVMSSEMNLLNTQRAIIKLSKGDLIKLKSLVDSAKSDFRDVIYWASQE